MPATRTPRPSRRGRVDDPDSPDAPESRHTAARIASPIHGANPTQGGLREHRLPPARQQHQEDAEEVGLFPREVWIYRILAHPATRLTTLSSSAMSEMLNPNVIRGG